MEWVKGHSEEENLYAVGNRMIDALLRTGTPAMESPLPSLLDGEPAPGFALLRNATHVVGNHRSVLMREQRTQAESAWANSPSQGRIFHLYPEKMLKLISLIWRLAKSPNSAAFLLSWHAFSRPPSHIFRTSHRKFQNPASCVAAPTKRATPTFSTALLYNQWPPHRLPKLEIFSSNLFRSTAGSCSRRPSCCTRYGISLLALAGPALATFREMHSLLPLT